MKSEEFFLEELRAVSIQPLLMPIMPLKASYQSTRNLAKIDNISEAFSYKGPKTSWQSQSDLKDKHSLHRMKMVQNHI